MGNSGSMNGLASYEEGGGYHQQGYHHHHQRYHDAMRGEAGATGGGMSSAWMDSYQRGEHGRRGAAGPREYDYLLHMHEQQQKQDEQGGHFPGSSQQQQQQQQQIKVLPDIPGKVAKLRSTNNGNILHAGGTISKNNQALQRSKSISSPTYQQHHQQQQQQPASFSECDEEMQRGPAQPPRLLMTRSRTQLHMVAPGGSRAGRTGRDASVERGSGGVMLEVHGARHGRERCGEGSPKSTADATAALNHRKRFGSEPDLRLSLTPRHGAPAGDQQPGSGGGGGGARKPNSAQSKIIKGKNKKKAAPVPPLIEKRDSSRDVDRQRIIAYSPMRKLNGDTSGSTLPSSGESSFNATATRKLRLFKTRAETKKTPAIAKLPEASDAKFTGHSAGPVPGGSSLMKSSSASSASSTQLILAHQHACHPTEQATSHEPDKSAPPRPNPTSFFRREKTFDAGLLGLERKRAIEPPPKAKPTMSPPLSRRKSIVKSLLEQEAGAKEQSRKASLAPAPAPAQTAAITDFQKELQLMTRRKQSPELARTAAASSRQQQPAAGKNHPAGTHQTSGAKSPFRVHVSGSGSGGGGSGDNASRSTPKGKPSSGLAKGLVIPVQAEKECEQVELPLVADARDSSPPATPPPPPPPPKTSFYFGMSGQQRPGDPGDGGLPASTNERLAEYFAERKAKSQQYAAAESRVDDSDDPGQEDAGEERQRTVDADGRLTPDEIGHTQMELIDQFAASLLNGNRYRSSDSVASSEVDVRVSTTGSSWDDGHQEIALKLRPTLPRKQFDIPRFSPAAAWRLLTTEDEFCRDAAHGQEDAGGESVDKKLSAAYLRVPTFEQEFDVPEDRIQRVYREPVPGLQDNKSGDSGISGDAGLPDLGEHQPLPKDRARDSTPEGSAGNKHMHQAGDTGGGVSGGWSSNALLLMPWTPQQDLEDDDDSTTGSGSDAPHREQLIENGPGEGRAGAHIDERGYSSKGHLFSLSLPRENHLSIYNVEVNDEKVEKHMFNSLQKFRKSVSGAFKSEESEAINSNDNWFLGRLGTAATGTGSRGAVGTGAEKHPKLLNPPTSYPSLDRTGREKDAGPDGTGGVVTSITQSIHSSIGYLVSGKHMMYLPREPAKIAHDHHGPDRPTGGSKQDQNNNCRTYRNQNGGAHEQHHHQQQQQQQPPQTAWNTSASQHRETPRERKVTPPNGHPSGGFVADSLPHETSVTRREDKENLQDSVPVGSSLSSALSPGELENFPVKLTNRRNHRFTFQSTIRQIEKRRVAEKLSREAEIKEAMRLSELEAMRRVEEEFQKKRAREKASIRHQLRLFSMENHPDQQQQHEGQDDGEHDLTVDSKRSDPDGDSLPHQNANGNGAGSGGRGLYRRKEFTSMERKRQYRSVNGTLQDDGGNGKHGSSAETAYNDFQQRHPTSDDDEDQHRYAMEDEDLVDERAGNDGGDRDVDDGDSSSLGYVDTRTPYISRIIQAKSSKSYGARK